MPATTQTRRITISVDTKGNQALNDIANRLGSVNKNTKSLADNMRLLTGAFAGWVSYLGIREIARMSDEMQNLSNRLKIVSRAGEDTTQTMAKLLELANNTNQSVSDVAEVYTRLGTSLKSANASSEQLLAVTQALINSFRISGSTNTETSATIIQLSQAFASGTLRGQELRSVMLQNAELARLLRERFGKDLAKKAEEGLISIVEVLKILRDNQERINNQAKVLAPTFEQTITKAFNTARFAISQFNEQFKLSEKFAVFVDFAVKSLSTLGRAAVDFAKVLTDQIDFKFLTAQVLVFAGVMNPLGAALFLVGGAAVYTSGSVGELIDKFRNLGAWVIQLQVYFEELAFSLNKKVAKAFFAVGAGSDEIVNKLALQLDYINELKNKSESLGTPKYSSQPGDAKNFVEDQKKAINDLIKAYEKLGFATEKQRKTKEILGEINAAYLDGIITISQYNDKLVNFELYKVNKEFREGKFDIFAYTDKLRQLKEQDFNRQFYEGAISIQTYNRAIESLRIDELRMKFEAGRITAAEYNAELVKLSRNFEPGGALAAGTQSYLDSIGTMSSNVADAIKNTFSSLEDSFLDFIKTGKFNFAQFTQGILDDLGKIIIRASIIRPLADALLGSISYGSPSGSGSYGGAGGSYTNTGAIAAQGLAFDKGIRRFAKGGLVDSPTMFGFGRGKTGLMGEAGPEAILPLKRGSGGNLGVQATVTPTIINIINQSGADIEKTETTGPSGERMIDILIQNKVREGIVGGSFDKAMKSAYGVSRKGS